MLRKLMFIGVLVLSMATMSVSPAEAHYLRTSTGYVFWHSTKCDLTLKSVPDPDSNPAQFECFVTVTLVDSLCENPQNRNVAPGQAATQTSIVATEQFTPEDITDKKKGLAHVEAVIPDDPLLKNEFCVNPNWHITDVLIREATVQYNVYQCSDTSCTTKVLHSSSESSCSLPAQFDFTNPPVPGDGYECTENFFAHFK